MGKPVRWSGLPKTLIDLIADRSSYIDLLRIRSICKPWRYAVATKKRFFNRFKRSLVGSSKFNRRKKSDLLSNTFFRVTQASSSCPDKGWLIKTRQISESSKINLLSPLSNELITCSDKTLDLLKFGVSEIHRSYNVQFLNKQTKNLRDSSRVVVVDNHVFVVDTNKQLWFSSRVDERIKWTRIKNEVVGKFFSDVILHRGQVYALDLKGIIWRINNSLDDFSVSQYGPSTPVKYRNRKIKDCKDKRFVEYCGDLCVVHRFCKKVDELADFERTNGFKVYKMDKELTKWVLVSSLEDKALIVATDSCFTVLASEYHGCLENAVYFSDDEDEYKFRKGVKGEGAKVLKLGDGRIINMIDSSSHSCFQMFSSPFL